MNDLYLPGLPAGYRWRTAPENSATLCLKLQRKVFALQTPFGEFLPIYRTEDKVRSPAPTHSSDWRSQIGEKANKMVLRLNGHRDIDSVKSRLSRSAHSKDSY